MIAFVTGLVFGFFLGWLFGLEFYKWLAERRAERLEENPND